jgi:hypothetical protein
MASATLLENLRKGEEMDKRTKSLTLLLSLALLVSLTMACIPGLPGLGGGTTEEETPVPPPPAVETPVSEGRCGDGVCDGPENPQNCPEDCEPLAPPPPGGEEAPFDVDVEALNNLDSYAYVFRFEGLSTSTGAVEHVTLDIEGRRQNRPTRAEQLSFSSTDDGQPTTLEFIYIEEQSKIWTREDGGQWEEIPVMDSAMLGMFDAFSLGFWWNALFTGSVESARLVGQEMVNGVQTNHYQTTETAAWAFAVDCNWGSVQDDAWVAVDGNFPVKRQFDAAGECEGESGEVHFLMEISNINQPVNISPPM